MIDKIYNKLIPLLVLIQPLFDVITSGMMKLGYSVTIGIFIKILLMIFCAIYLVFIDKKNNKKNFLFFSVFGIFSILNIINNIQIIKLQTFEYFNYMFKYIYLNIMLLYFIRWFKNGNNIKLYQFRIPIIIIVSTFVLSIITDTAILSYDEYRRGISAWFNSANEIGSLLCLLFPISLFNALHNKERKKIDLFLFVLCGISMLLVGTKVGLFGFVITLLCYIFYRIIMIRKNKLDIKFVFAIIVLVIPMLFFKEIPTIYNTNVKISNFQANEITEADDKINDVIFSGRDEYTKKMKENRQTINYISVLFGKSYLKDGQSILIVEQDLKDIYYMYGFVGISILCVLFICTLLDPIKYFIKDLRKNIYNIKSIICIIAILLVIAIAYISGHVLLSPSVSTFLTLVIAILYEKCSEKEITDKKKMIIYMSKLSVGGMEQALINLLNMSDFVKNYSIDLYLGYSTEKKYIDSVPKEVNISLLCKGKWNLISKITTAIKMTFSYINLIVNPYKYDVSICYAYQHGILADLAKLSSKNNILFIHGDLLKCKTPKELSKLKKKMKFDKFSKIVCVSENSKKSFLKIYPNYSGKIKVINNYIDGNKILKLSNEKVKDIKKAKVKTFINVGRHEEKAKKITRIIEASKKLNEKKYEFRVLLVGDGEDYNLYKKMIEDYNLENIIFLLGKKVNPYPYYKLSDCLIVSSEYEGYGVVLDEARILGLPVITTDVGDSKKIISEGYGILSKNSSEGIYTCMKEFLESGIDVNNKFEYNKFNSDITEKLNEFIVGDVNEKSNVYF